MEFLMILLKMDIHTLQPEEKQYSQINNNLQTYTNTECPDLNVPLPFTIVFRGITWQKHLLLQPSTSLTIK